MKNLSILLYESKLMFTIFFRDKLAIFWTYLFPAGLLILFSSLFSSKDNPAIASGMLVSIISISIMSGGLFGIGMVIVQSREAGIFKRYKTTPLSSWIIFASHILTRSILILSTLFILVIISIVGFNVHLRGNLFIVTIIVFLGIFTFCALGFVVSCFVKTIGSAIGVINLLFFLMMFIGGFFPLEMLPKWLKIIAMLFPVTYFRNIIFSTMVEGKSIINCWLDLLILIGFLLVFSAISVKWFHWDRVS